MLKTTAALIMSAMLAACGGGGSDGGSAPAALVSEKKTASAPNSASRLTNDWLVELRSAPSVTGLTGDVRYRACVRGVWRQTLKSAANLRLSLSVYGQQVRTVDFGGVAGADNRIEFSGCAETFTRTAVPTYPAGSAAIQVQALTNRAAYPVDGYDVEIEWTVTQVQ